MAPKVTKRASATTATTLSRAPRAKASRRAKRVRKPAANTASVVVTIRAQRGNKLVEAYVGREAPLERIAAAWTYVLRSRARWADDMDVRTNLRKRALQDLASAGVSRDFLQQLVSVQHVEVELHPWDSEDLAASRVHEAAASLAWEYLLSVATRELGRFRSLLITRVFRNASPAVIAAPKHVLFVESGPGRLEDAYQFESERARIRAAVGADDDEPGVRTLTFSKTEKVSDLRKRVRAGARHANGSHAAYDVIHVTGVDTHEAAQYIEGFYEDLRKARPAVWTKLAGSGDEIPDGIVLREATIAELPLAYDEAANVFVDDRHPPYLVTLNLHHSGARTAREIVRLGAHAALGFLDEIDEEVAELFFQAFYWEWCRPEGAFTISAALQQAWQQVRGKGERLHGTAIVMWLGHSVFEEHELQDAPSTVGPVDEQSRQTALERLRARPVDELLHVDLEVDREINYSLLHNDRPLLQKLTLSKLVKEPLEDVAVYVELQLGGQTYPYRRTHVVMNDVQLVMAPTVQIPLTATLPRSLRERVHSTVYVRVSCGGRTAFERTDRVTLIPVDEWLDDTDNNPWLPSFVMPRDPAVLNVISAARRYLVGILDDPSAGFDGYQSVDPDADEPTAGVDAQVRAIWSALVNDFRLQYINPPPAYSDQTQRLRTPSDIVQSNTGTCIDLALLLASCLEYIDIYPVIVLLSGHAFVGYWRSEEFHNEFVEVTRIPEAVPAAGGTLARASRARFVDHYGWRLTRMQYDEVMAHVVAGELVPLEATYLTTASRFADAIEEGRANLRSRREFESLLDVRLARLASPPVTPLPIIHSANGGDA